MKTILFATLILLLPNGGAFACLNDRDVLASENEFRSAYLDSPPSESGWKFPYGAIQVAGGILLTGGSAFLLLKKPSRSSQTSAKHDIHA